jgi:hypothetical protein
VFLRLVAKLSDRFLEQRIYITFWVKLGKTASDTYAMFSEAYGEEAVKNTSVLEWNTRLKESSNIEITNEDNAYHFVLYQSYCSLRIHFTFHKAIQSTQLIMCKYWSGYAKLYLEKAWNLAQRLDIPPWQCSSSEGALCQVVSVPTIDYWKWTRTLFPCFCSKLLMAVFENKFCLKGTKI